MTFGTHEQRVERLQLNKAKSAASREVENLEQRVERLEGNIAKSSASRAVETPEHRVERTQ